MSVGHHRWIKGGQGHLSSLSLHGGEDPVRPGRCAPVAGCQNDDAPCGGYAGRGGNPTTANTTHPSPIGTIDRRPGRKQRPPQSPRPVRGCCAQGRAPLSWRLSAQGARDTNAEQLEGLGLVGCVDGACACERPVVPRTAAPRTRSPSFSLSSPALFNLSGQLRGAACMWNMASAWPATPRSDPPLEYDTCRLS